MVVPNPNERQHGVLSIGQRYREKKTAVLDVWRRYRSFRGQTEDGVTLSVYDDRAKALEEGRYVLAVVGEAKAGKSTFINALLGERILPTDVLQSSSAIVEIFKSDKKFVKVRYADDHTEVVQDDLTTADIDEASEHLRSIGALPDRFRSIPTALIDAYIVQEKITPDVIPFEDLQNMSRMSLADKRAVIEDYVQGRSLDKIPVAITFGFPLRYAFDELIIVDSPGVNALGGVQDITFNYLPNANAVLFVHSIENPVEQGSFREFVTQIIPDKTRQSLFLVLSKSGFRSVIEIEEKVAEARSLFSGELDPNRVLHVDSMLKIMANDILSFGTALEMKAHYAERKKFFEDKYHGERRQDWRDDAVNFGTKLRLLTNVLEDIGNEVNRETARAELLRLSNFEAMEQVIEEFSARAPELQLSDLLIAVKRGYDNQSSFVSQDIDLLAKKRKHTQTFENEINEIQQILKEYQRELNEFTESVHQKYKGVNAVYRKCLEQLKESFEGQVGSASSEAAVFKVLIDFDDKIGQLVAGVVASINQSVSEKLEQLGSEYKAKHDVTVPTVDVEGIAKKAARDAWRTKLEKVGSNRGEAAAGGGSLGAIAGGVIGFFFGGPFGAVIGAGVGGAGGAGAGYAAGDDYHIERTIFDKKKYLGNLQSRGGAAIQHVAGETVDSSVRDFVDEHKKSFKSSVGTLMKDRRDALEEIRTRKAANHEILQDIVAAERKKKQIEDEVIQVDEMLENLR